MRFDRPCERPECEETGCKRFSPAYGHLCDECFEELAAQWLGGNTGLDVDMFMESDKDTWMRRTDMRSHLEGIFLLLDGTN